VTQFRSVALLLVLGTLGAMVSMVFLLIIPSDGVTMGYRQLIGEDLPVLVFVAGTGFGMGALIAVLWLFLQRLFAVQAPRA
jgi:hypothetical protein